jgi:hypothetical protein
VIENLVKRLVVMTREVVWVVVTREVVWMVVDKK